MAKYFWLMREPWFTFGIKIGKHYFKLKRTTNELFSERNGYVRVRRFAGWSFITFKDKSK